MNKLVVLKKEEFLRACDYLNVGGNIDLDYVYEIYYEASTGIDELTHDEDSLIKVDYINPLEIIQYCLGEYIYSVAGRNQEQIEEFKKNEKIKESMISVVADKYLSLSKFEHHERKLTSKFFPPISSISTYINFMLNILNTYQRRDPSLNLIADLLFKSLSIAKCTCSLLVDGFETEAFSTWRTLHECECTLTLLDRYQDVLIKRYLKHMEFGIAFKDAISDKEQQTAIFNRMKEEMRGYNLKSKDIKKYIEYGWLYSIDGVADDPDFKLNFRDGLEKLAGLSMYNHRYEMSSEIIHSTPLLIYSNKEYFYYITLLSLYESFFRLEKVFVSLFINKVNQEIVQRYQEMRNIYYTQLINIHQRELNNFRIWTEHNKSQL